jgi:hypothetical protein
VTSDDAMRKFANAFFISSPLQLVVVDALLGARPELSRDDVVIFVENKQWADFFQNFECIVIENTRLEGRNLISQNLAVIEARLADRVTLWVSDILWPMNNAIYTRLRRGGQLEAINFFDEGMVLYWVERLTWLSWGREWIKFLLLRLKLGLRFTLPARAPFYGNKRNGKVYALHSDLLSRPEMAEPLAIDLKHVSYMKERLEEKSPADRPAGDWAENAAVFLSQPYYRVTSEEKFAAVLSGMANYLRKQGHSQLYVKLHPSEGTEVFNRYYRDLGFEIVFAAMKGPVEIALQDLPASCTLVSFNSSALLNACKFGFPGQRLSYGLNWVAKQYPMRRNLLALNRAILEGAGVRIALH